MGAFNDLLKKLMQGLDNSNQTTTASIQAMLALIKAEENLRFYVDGSKNFGHQATTVNILKRLVDATDYDKAIKIIYAGDDTPSKLAIMLTDLVPDNIATASITYGKATITFLKYTSDLGLDSINYGFTGGADSKAINYAATLNVKYFLRLQPYLWEKAPNQVERIGEDPFNLSEESAFFAQLAYKFPSDSLTTVPAKVWTWYGVTQTYNPTLKIRTKNAQAIYNAKTTKAALRLWPIYGLHQFDQPAEKTLNLILSGLSAQLTQNGPTSLFILSDIPAIQKKYLEMPFDYAAAFAVDLNTKDQKLTALKKKLKETFIDDDFMNSYSEVNLNNFILKLGAQVKPLMDQGFTLTLVEGYKDGNYVEIEDLTATLTAAGDKELVAITLGPIPQEVYNYFYANAGLPGVFEGQGTSSLPISLGAPFLQIPKSGEDDRANYPSTLSSVNYSGPAQAAKSAALTLRNQGFDQYLTKTSPKPPEDYYTSLAASGTFFVEAYTERTEINVYFTSLGAYYQQDIHDKLMLGVVGVKLVGDDALSLDEARDAYTKAILTSAATTLTLDDVYSQLISNYNDEDGGVNILNALPNTYFTSFFKLVTGNLFFIKVAKTEITKTPESGTITKVELANGTTKAFGPDFKITLDFTAPEKSVVTEISTVIDKMWNIDGVPWVGFEKPGFNLKINEGGSPVDGGLIGTIIGQGKNSEGKAIELNTMIKYPVEEDTWLIFGGLPKPLSVSSFYQMAGGVNLVQVLQPPLNGLSGFGLSEIQLHYNQKTSSFDYMSYAMKTESPWQLSADPLFEITPSVDVQIYNVQDVKNRKIEFSVIGTFTIGEGTVTVTGSYPNFEVNGGLTDGVISINDLLDLFGAKIDDFDTSVTLLDFNLKPNEKYYELNTIFESEKPLNIADLFSITKLSFGAKHNSGKNEISLGGQFFVLPESLNIGVSLQSTYVTNNGWTFSGTQTSGKLEIGEILTFYIAPDWVPESGFNYGIDGLGFKINTKTKYWEFTAKTADPWVIEFIDLEVSGNATVAYGKKDEKTEVGHYGNVSAFVDWFGIEFQAYYDYKPGEKTWGIIWEFLKGEVTNTGTKESPHWIGTISFTDSTTVGSIVEKMISWATGSAFGLGAPWNLLDKIPLNNLALVYDFTNKKVSFKLDIGPIPLGFATINAISVSYNSGQEDPNDNGVIVNLDGSFLWQDDPSKPLSWDAAKPEETPAPSGQGNKYLDLRLLALGQHVTIPGFQDIEKVQDAIALMADLPKTKPGEIPGITLDANSNWLVGMDFGVLRLGEDSSSSGDGEVMILADSSESQYMMTLQIVFNDPYLYALRIALDGKPAKIFAGLDFQILYKKISDTVGMYKAELALPTVMRKISLGQVNITLPVFGIEIYTNGDFQVDIGFPWKEDFSRSFTFQTLIWTPVGIPIPVMGSAGFYFGKLSSATTDKVPETILGTFNPVLVFGIGIQVGLGYDFDAGILKAGFSLTLVTILEGVLAKYNPYTTLPAGASSDNSQVAGAYYFWFRGTIGIIGKLYGTVDFSIIKAELSIDIRILAQITFSPYEDIIIQLSASVSVSLKVTINLGIFKIHISLSFSASISQKVTINAIAHNPPWGDPTPNIAFAQEAPRLFIHAKKLRALQYDFRFRTLEVKEVTPVWSNLVNATTVTPLTGYLGLGLTAAGDKAYLAPGGPDLKEQVACYVSMLFIESVQPPQEDRESAQMKAFTDTPDSSFELLSKEIFRWVIASIQGKPITSADVDKTVVTTDDLTNLIAYFSDPVKEPIPIPTDAIDAFMAGQFNLTIEEQPTDPTQVNATYFPMATELELTTPDYGDDYKGVSYDFGNYNSITQQYIDNLRIYFDDLAIKVQDKPKPDAMSVEGGEDISVGNFVFSDYFSLICKQMIQTAQDSLKDFKYFTTAGETSDVIVAWINENGELTGDMAYSVFELFTDNVGVTLNKDKKMYVPDSTYTVQQGDTFNSIAAKAMYGNAVDPSFTGNDLAVLNQNTQNILQANIEIKFTFNSTDYEYKTLPSQSLKEILDSINEKYKEHPITMPELIEQGKIATLANLLLPVGTIKISQFIYTTVDGDTLRSIASKFSVSQQILATPVDKKNNGAIPDLFNSSTLDMAELAQFKVGELLKEIQATQGLQHLSGMTSRFYMAGLKLPVDGVTPNFPGMWVDDGTLSYGKLKFTGLYALNGQQFPIPALTEGNNFDITFSKPASLKWFEFAGSDPEKRIISIVPGSTDAIRINKVTDYATKNRLDTGLNYLGTKNLFTENEATYPYTSEIVWNAASAVNLPYGGTPTGVPALSLWLLPDSLLQLPDLASRAVNPRMEFLIGQYDDVSRTMVNHDIGFYGLGSLVEVTIKKVPVIAESPSTMTTYEIVGANGNNADILEKIISQVQDNDSLIDSIIPAYAVNSNGSTKDGIQTDAQNVLTMGLAQVNLSTETRPPVGASTLLRADVDDAQEGINLLIPETEFLRLLWQASITRNGGYYLYYYNADSKQGLPDRIFDDNNEAKLSFIVLYAQPAEVTLKNTVASYMNVFACGEAFDQGNSVLFSQANPNTITLPTTTTQTLAALANDYFGNVADVAEDNNGLTLRAGVVLNIDEGVYEVGVGGTTLDKIEERFATTVAAIQAINKEKSGEELPNNLKLFDSIFLPKLPVTIGTSPGGSTLQEIADFYGENLASIANFNQTVKGIFADNQNVVIKGGPVVRSANVAPGDTSIEAIRTIPPPVPEDPNAANFGKIFLQNVYSSLTYQIVQNAYFSKSNVGLPTGPTTIQEDPANIDKVQVPKDYIAGDEWEYQIAIPYSRFSIKGVNTLEVDLPDPTKSPYKGLGHILQVNFAWQDIYGNSIISELSDPSGSSGEPLNEPPILTGYTDPIIGLNQWPSIASSWIISGDEGAAKLDLLLNFDSSYYQGLIAVEKKDANTILGKFTVKVDETTATDPANYKIDQNVEIDTIALDSGGTTVTITTKEALPADVTITVTISNILAADTIDPDTKKPLAFNGWAKFDINNSTKIASSSVKDQAIRDLQTYTQIWYQLTDPNGISFTINTTLVKDPFTLSQDQVTGLVQTWIASIYQFLANRSTGGTGTVPEAEHLIDFDIVVSELNADQIFKLDLSFSIERTGGAISGDFETTGGIKVASTVIPPMSKATSDKNNPNTGLDEFAQSFEKALSKANVYQLRITTGVDREENLSNSGATEIWATRLGVDKSTSIGYEITNIGNPLLFAPKPISTKLQTRPLVPIYDFDPKTGIDFTTPSKTVDFQNVDMDVWGRLVFTDIDSILTPEYTAAIQLVDKFNEDAGTATQFLTSMLDHKKRLAEVIKLSMVIVLANQSGGDMTDIQEVFLQQLLVKLSNAYTTRAGVQFDAKVQATKVAQGTIAPKLYGNINQNFIYLGAELNDEEPNKVNLFLSNFMTSQEAEKVTNYSASDDITVTKATLSTENARIVTLELSEKAVVEKTIISVVDTLVDVVGNVITIPLSQIVKKEVSAENFSDSFSLSSPKLSLDESEKATLPFLISSQNIIRGTNDEVISYVDLDLTYSGFAIEHQISEVPGIKGDYLASSWLGFVTRVSDSPLEQGLGKFKVPLVLRSFPTPPAMVNQDGSYPYDPTMQKTIEEILTWNYLITYSQSYHYPQDQIDFEIKFNVTSNSLRSDATLLDAFNEMAEFISVFESINAVFTNVLMRIDASTTESEVFEESSIALKSYNEVVERLVSKAESAQGLTMSNSNNKRTTGNVVPPYKFYIKEGNITVGQNAGLLLVNIFGKIPDDKGMDVPIVNISGYNAIKTTPQDKADYSYYYESLEENQFLLASVGQAIPEREVVIPMMNLLARQDAETTAQLQRNVELIPGEPSSIDFIYTTGQIEFSSPFYPNNDVNDKLNVATINDPANPNIGTLEDQLTILFNTLLAKNSQDTISVLMTCGYSYKSNPALSDINLPVIMQPLESIQVKGEGSDKPLAQMINEWSTSIVNWYDDNKVDSTDGMLWFDLTIFTNLTEQPKPLIRLRKLYLSIQLVTDMTDHEN